MSKSIAINGYRVFPFQNREVFITYLDSGNWHNILVALNAEKLIREDVQLRNLVNNNIGYPDGIGAVWALKKAGKKAAKIPGAEFWLDIINAFHQEKTFYLIGGKSEVIEKTVKKLKIEFPNMKLEGYSDGYFGEKEYEDIKKDILNKKPDVIFVAMGSPRQEYIMEDLNNQHKALYMGLGGSYDVYTGIIQRAPELWRKFNLEWSYRLVKQPTRFIRQLALIKFAYRLIFNRL